MTKEEYEQKEKDQDYRCAICGEHETHKYKGEVVFRLSIDHNHVSGTVRGLLCKACNLGIGYLKESTDRLRKAIEYLDRHKE
jgi:Recombination endonuclease VII